MLVPDVRAEFEGVVLGDPRLATRVQRMAAALVEMPGASLPRAMGRTAAREGAYRFLSNRRVTLDRVIAAHVAATVERARLAKKVLVVSDTTEFAFSTEREGLGLLSSKRRDGFIAHFKLAVSGDGRRTPLGVLGVETIVRTARKGRRDNVARKKDPERESLRWRRGVDSASEHLDDIEAIHVMDREADIYELLCALVENGRRFIIRSGQERLLDEGLLSTAVESTPLRFSREVKLSARRPARQPESRRRNPARRGRLAQLAVSTTRVTLHKPKAAFDPELPVSITVNVVRVWELDPVPGEPPVEWRLFTSEPVDTQEQVEQIVDGYRARWVIEEYFKALKTGCNFEQSQLESFGSLENLLGVYIPVAWQLLVLRSTARDEPHRPASDALSPQQLTVLRLIVRGKPLPPEPTIGDVATAIADLGAHIKSNGPPGWQVLGRGFEELRRAEHLYLQIIPATSCDQS
jgi:hypothetical protein